MYFQHEVMSSSLRPPDLSTLTGSFHFSAALPSPWKTASHGGACVFICTHTHTHTHTHETYWCSQASPGTFHTASQNEPKFDSLTLFFNIKDTRSLELFTATRPSWEALQSIAQRFTELCQPPPHDKAVIHERGTIKILTRRPNEKESVFLKTELAIVHYCL